MYGNLEHAQLKVKICPNPLETKLGPTKHDFMEKSNVS
jgi:hypothetical protein